MSNKFIFKLSIFYCSFLFLSLDLVGQEHSFIIGKSIQQLRAEEFKLLEIHARPFLSPYIVGTAIVPTKNATNQPPSFLNTYDVNDLAFFCKLEVKIEKKLKFPFKFRLGEVQYTERMEGKH